MRPGITDETKDFLHDDMTAALDQFEATRDPGWLIEAFRRALQYSDVRDDYPEVWDLLREAGERWGSGLAVPTDPKSAPVLTLSQAFRAKDRGAKFKPTTGDLRLPDGSGSTVLFRAYQEVERLRRQKAPRLNKTRRRQPNVFGEAAKRLPRGKNGKPMSEITVERCWQVAKTIREQDSEKYTHE